MVLTDLIQPSPSEGCIYKTTRLGVCPALLFYTLIYLAAVTAIATILTAVFTAIVIQYL